MTTQIERIAALEAKLARLESASDVITPSSIPTIKHRLAVTVAGPASYPTQGSKFYISFLDGTHVRTVDDADPGTFAARKAFPDTVCFNLSKTLPALGTYLNVFEWGGYWWTHTADPGPPKFIKIFGTQPCQEITGDSACVFVANLVTYNGDDTYACAPWTVGAAVFGVATNQCEGTPKARIGDIYRADLLLDAFTSPGLPTLPLYAFRSTAKPVFATVKITNPGTECDEIEASQYCHWEAKLVTYGGGTEDACGDWIEGDDVYVTFINTCGTLKTKIGDQYQAVLLTDGFDPGGAGSDLRPLYAIHVPTPSPGMVETIKITNAGTACDIVEKSAYCHFDARIVTYHGGDEDACAGWTSGSLVWATSINRCGDIKAPIGDQFTAYKLLDSFDPGGAFGARPLYGFRSLPPVATSPVGTKWFKAKGIVRFWRIGDDGTAPATDIGSEPLIRPTGTENRVYAQLEFNLTESSSLATPIATAISGSPDVANGSSFEIQETGTYKITVKAPETAAYIDDFFPTIPNPPKAVLGGLVLLNDGLDSGRLTLDVRTHYAGHGEYTNDPDDGANHSAKNLMHGQASMALAQGDHVKVWLVVSYPIPDAFGLGTWDTGNLNPMDRLNAFGSDPYILFERLADREV